MTHAVLPKEQWGVQKYVRTDYSTLKHIKEIGKCNDYENRFKNAVWKYKSLQFLGKEIESLT